MDREARQVSPSHKRKLSRKHFIRGSFYNEVIFEQRADGRKGGSHVDIWEKFLGRDDNPCKNREVEAGLRHLEKSKES